MDMVYGEDFSYRGGKLRAVLLPDSDLASNQNALILFFA